jgi:hypothetical protein
MASQLDLSTLVLMIDPSDWDPNDRDFDVIEATVNPVEDTPSGAEGEEVRRRRAHWIHEIVHFWQCIWLPYLYLHATLAWKAISVEWDSLRENREAIHWRNSPLPRDETAWAGLNAEQSFRNQAGQESPQLSPWRMMENAASLFQYEVSVGIDAHPSADGYEQWALSNPSYLDVYDFVTDQFGREEGFQLFPSMVAASFFTTNPVRTFLRFLNASPEVVASLSQDFRAHSLGIMTDILANAHPHYDFQPGASNDPATNYFLQPRKMESMPIEHPVLGPFRKRWLDDVKGGGYADIFLEFPQAIPGVRIDRWLRLMRRFRPPIIVTLHHDGAGGRTPSKVLVHPGPLGMQEVNRILAQHALLGLLGALRGEEAHRPVECACHDCRFHATNLCRGIIRPPTPGPSPENRCLFPQLLERWGARLVASDELSWA